MSTLTAKFEQDQMKKVPDIRPGDTVKIHQKIKEGDKERIQIFQGVVIARKHGKGISSTITVRKVVDGVGVEKIVPVHSPSLEKIEVVKSSSVRRSKLYYLRTAKGAKGKLKNKDLAVAIAPASDEISGPLRQSSSEASEAKPESEPVAGAPVEIAEATVVEKPEPEKVE